MENYKCLLCKERKYQQLINFGKYHVVKCKNCQLVCFYPLPQKMQPGDDYENLNLDKFFKYLKRIRLDQYKKELKVIRKYAPGNRLLDVGCAQGWFLKEAEKQGFKVIGIEPSTKVTNWAKKYNPGVKIIVGEFLTGRNKLTKYDVITFWSVLEHMTEPMLALKLAYKKLTINGLLAIRVPNFSGLIPQVIIWFSKTSFGKFKQPAKSLYEYDCHYKHFFHFNENSLRLLLKKTGFKIVKIKKDISIDIAHFNERVEASRKKGLNWSSKAVIRLAIRLILNLSKLLGLEDELVIFAQKTNND